jgi:ATP-binding cassette subfamily B protein
VKDLPRFLSYFRRRPGTFALGFLSMAGSTVLFLAMPRLVRRALETLSVEGVSHERLYGTAALLVALAAGDAVCLFYTRRILIGASRDIEYEMRQDLFAHLLELPASWYRENRVGDLMSRAVNDLSAVRMLVGPGVMQGVHTLFVGVVSIFLMTLVSPMLTLVALSMLQRSLSPRRSSGRSRTSASR